jgi:excisionase family DNA binding protein
MKVDLDDLITQKEAARIRGVSVQAINDLVRRGRIETVTIGGRKFLSRSEVEGFKPALAGRPKSTSTKKRTRPRKSN